MYENISIKDTIKQNWDERSSTFDLSPGHVIGSKEEKEAWISLFKEKFGKGIQKILDIGTGTGFLSIILAEMGYDVVGVDLSEEMLDRHEIWLEHDMQVHVGETVECKLLFGHNIW